MSTDWIQPGTEILRFHEARAGAPTSSRKGVITTVASTSFKIDVDDHRYTRDERPTAKVTRARSPHASPIRVIPFDSDRARKILAAEHLDSLRGQAVTAVDEWRINYGGGDIDATIDALTTYRDALKGAER